MSTEERGPSPNEPDTDDTQPRHRPLTMLQATIDQLNRTVQNQISCVHDVLRPGTSEGAETLGILECARCGLIQEARPTRPRRQNTSGDRQ